MIAHDQLPEAILALQNLLSGSPKLDEAILQSARFEDIRKQIRLGTASFENANLTKNQIRAGLLDLLQTVEEKKGEPAIGEEMDKAVKHIVQYAEKIYNIGHIETANFS